MFFLSGPKADLFKGPVFLLPATAKRPSLPPSALTPSLTFFGRRTFKGKWGIERVGRTPHAIMVRAV